VFQNYLSYSALARADDEAVTGGFNDRSRDDMKVIHAENSLDLGEESRQELEISSGHPNGACYYFRNISNNVCGVKGFFERSAA
jgi:hypothetical protein